MGTLYIDRQGLSLHLQGGVIELRADGERLRTVPARLLDRVVLRADTQLSSGTLGRMGARGRRARPGLRRAVAQLAHTRR